MPVCGIHRTFLPGGTAVQQGETSLASETAFLHSQSNPRICRFSGLHTAEYGIVNKYKFKFSDIIIRTVRGWRFSVEK